MAIVSESHHRTFRPLPARKDLGGTALVLFAWVIVLLVVYIFRGDLCLLNFGIAIKFTLSQQAPNALIGHPLIYLQT